ncbi:DUF1640 domain-containing protein [Sodalis sp. (in: enterobacteria)]|uniref:DUF1640 domain-containing protein n=1 Tax=Sodalis sp. (in: enterobacteria) TaxID=1898979 RepID=UPI003F3E9938
MGQVAFDTLQASEELETAGISREQARAISLVVRKSHEVADVATKRDLEDVRKEMIARFEKNEAQMDARFDKVDARFEKTEAQIADVRKDMAAGFDKLSMQMTIRLGLMVAAGVSIIAAILKM